MDVLSVSRCSIRALSSSMEVRVIDVPHLHILSHPVVKHVFSMLPSLHPLLPLSRTYELLQWLIASLWHVTGDLEFSSDWTTWNAFTERLKCVFVHSLATDQGFDNLCAEHTQDSSSSSSKKTFSPLRNLLESGKPEQATPASIVKFFDSVFINSSLFDEPPSAKFGHHAWNFGTDPTSEGDACNNTTNSSRPPLSSSSTEQRQSSTHWERKECAALALGLHLLFESLKIQPSYWSELNTLGTLLADLCAILGLQQFVRYHTTLLCVSENHSPTMRAFDHNESLSSYISQNEFSDVFGECSSVLLKDGVPFDIHSILADVLHGPQHAAHSIQLWPKLPSLQDSHPIQIATNLLDVYYQTFCTARSKNIHAFQTTWWSCLISDIAQRAALQEAVTRGWLSIGVSQLLLEALQIAKDHADYDWPEEVKYFVGRMLFEEGCRMYITEVAPSPSLMFQTRDAKILRLASERAIGKMYNASLVDDDGVQLDAEFSGRWADGRLDSVQAMLSTAVPISISGRGDGTD
ncbi:cyclosome subunit-like protein, putative, partial [Bodo saltans]